MGMNEAEVTGAIVDVAEGMVKGAAPLAKIGVDGPARSVELHSDLAACAKADADQEEAKRILVAKTAAKNALYRRTWVKASGYLDVLIAAVGKDSRDAENYRRILSRVHDPPEDDAAPTPSPVPVPGRTQ